jgi:hypothetical protein
MKGWRTLIIMSAIAVIGVAQQADWANLVPAADVGYVMAGIGAAGAFLRLITNTSPGSKS